MSYQKVLQQMMGMTLGVLLLAGCGSTPTPEPTTAEYVLQFDGEPDRLQRPVSIAIDQEGNLYVLDQNNFRIQKFDREGNPVTKWGTVGSGDGQFAFTPWLNGLAVDGQGNVYVTDDDNHRIQKFDSNGQFLMKWGSDGSGDGEFNVPTDVAVDAQGNVYVTDWEPDQQTTRVQKFDSDGNFLTKWDSLVKGPGRDVAPNVEIAVDDETNVYIVDEILHRILKFDGDGKLLSTIGEPGTNDGQFNYPWGIAVDGGGNLYVADSESHRIQKFDSDGKFLFKWGTGGGGDGEFNWPTDVAVDRQGNVYVTDYNNNRIQRFQQK